jgi:hypothetical protein
VNPQAQLWIESIALFHPKVWTQDAIVMAEWRDPKTLVPNAPHAQQDKFFAWVRDNVDFQPRLQRVD